MGGSIAQPSGAVRGVEVPASASAKLRRPLESALGSTAWLFRSKAPPVDWDTNRAYWGCRPLASLGSPKM